jgi:uncharacterized protein (TIGR03089 family)
VTFVSSDLPHPLQVALSSDAARPRLTFYDDATGERVELSAQSLAGWVIKTMNLLVDDVGVDADTVVSLHLPLHWLTAVWVMAADASGVEVRTAEGGTGPSAVVDAGFEERFAVSLRPMAVPLGADRPDGFRDYCSEVRTMPDQLVQPVPALGALSQLAARRAGELSLLPGERVFMLAIDDRPVGPTTVVEGLLAALEVDGSAVWTRNPDAARCVSRWRDEQVTAVLGPLPPHAGGRLPASMRHLGQSTG